MLDTSWLSYMMPLWAFLLVLVTTFAILLKTGIVGDNKALLFIISGILGIILISFTQIRELLVTLVPWFSTLLITVFFLALAIAFIAKDVDAFMKPITWVFIALFAIIVIAVAAYVFPEFYHMLPKTSNAYLSTPLRGFKIWLYSRRIFNTIIFIIATAIIGFVITKK